MTELDRLRGELDSIDDQIAALFARRMEIGLKVGLYKKNSDFPVNDPGREDAVIKRIKGAMPPLSAGFAEALMKTMFDASKELQRRIKGDYFVIGKRLPHSWSPEIYLPLGLDYRIKELPDEESVKSFVNGKNFTGINVTIPYKQTVIPLLDDISDEAEAVGAVNTVVNRGGKLYGYNTDVGGMTEAILSMGVKIEGVTAAVFGGNGGTAHTARYVLKKLGAGEIITVSRKGEVNYENIYDYPVEFIVNATPCGMYPEINSCPAEPGKFKNLKGVFDAVYNPLKTSLVEKTLALGVPALNGLTMLVEQGRLAYELFTGSKLDKTVTRKLVNSIELAKANVVIEGMPGSGKSSVGKETARLLGKNFIDTDEEIERAYGKSVPEIFAKEGEAFFRKLECEIVLKAASSNGVVIATGGGAVLNSDNREALKHNGVIVYLKRGLDELESAGRPLSLSRGVDKLYAERSPIYEEFADFSVENDGIERAAKKIAEEFLKFSLKN